jgi:hypothetical protein
VLDSGSGLINILQMHALQHICKTLIVSFPAELTVLHHSSLLRQNCPLWHKLGLAEMPTQSKSALSATKHTAAFHYL